MERPSDWLSQQLTAPWMNEASSSSSPAVSRSFLTAASALAAVLDAVNERSPLQTVPPHRLHTGAEGALCFRLPRRFFLFLFV